MQSYVELLQATTSDKVASFRPAIKFDIGKVIDVYDGDTVTIMCGLTNDQSNTLYTVKVRIMGIDTPELRTKNPLEKELSQHIRDHLSRLILGRIVYVKQTDAVDKWGRILAYITYYKDKKPIEISNWLIEHKYAVPYSGETKGGWAHLTRASVDDIKLTGGSMP